MKHLLFIFLLTPCLCFSQLGINTQNPEAVLHLSKGQTDRPTFKLEGLEIKKEKEDQSYSNLIIYDDGTIKKTEPDARIGYTFYFDQDFELKKSNPENIINNITVKNFSNPEAVNQDGQIVIPENGTYAFSFRFLGMTTGDFSTTNYSFGQVVLRISKENSSGQKVEQEELMDWIVAPLTTMRFMSYSANTQATFQKGDIVHFALEKLNTSPDNLKVESIIFEKARKDNDIYATSFIMWRM